MKKLLLAGLLALLPLSASDYFLALGTKTGTYNNNLLMSTTMKGSILTEYGAFGLGKDLSVANISNDFTAISANNFVLSFEYLHYGYLIDLDLVKIGLGYDIGGGGLTTSTAINIYLQMEASVDLIVALGDQWAINIGYAQPWIMDPAYASGANGRVSVGFRLISRN